MNYQIVSVLFLFTTVFFIWTTLFFTKIENKSIRSVAWWQDACSVIRQQKVPEFALLEDTSETGFTSTVERYDLSNCQLISAGGTWELKYRPIVGDHIHIGIVISVNNTLFEFHDRNMTHFVKYEDDNYPVTCPDKRTYAYEKIWYHTGVHTHCDGIVHVHPWSSPNQLRVEGRDVKLKMWFESVGIEVAPDKSGLKLPGQELYIENWELRYYTSATNSHVSFITTDINEMINLWLVDHHGLILLYVGDVPRKDLRVLKYKKHPNNYPSRYV